MYLLLQQLPLIYNAPKAELATQITAFSIFFLGVHQVTTGILQGLNKPRIPVINMGIALVIKVILNWTLTAIPWLGIGGAAWATVADIGFAALLNLIYIKKIHRLLPRYFPSMEKCGQCRCHGYTHLYELPLLNRYLTNVG